MPVYEYQCKNCDYQFEENQSFSEPALKICPKCKTESLKKLYSAVGIVFKGSGFYKNDSKTVATAAGQKTTATDIPAKGDTKNDSSPKKDVVVNDSKSNRDNSNRDNSNRDNSSSDKSSGVAPNSANTGSKGSTTKGELSSTGSK